MGNYHPHGDGRDLRHPRAHGPGLQHARPAGRRPGQLRLRGRRPARGHALHRGPPHPRSASIIMADIEKDTVDFQPDLRRQLAPSRWSCPPRSPTCWSTAPPASRSGMATNIPPHNLGEVVDALPFLLENQDLTPDERLEGVMERIPGPDFPTAGLIFGRAGIRQAYRTGRGSVVMRARAEIETRQGRQGVDRRHRDPLPGEQGAPHREDRRAGARQEARRHRRHPRRERPPRACASWSTCSKGEPAQVHPEQPLQAHPAAGHLRHHHARHRRPAAADAEPPRGLRALPRLPARGGAPAHRLRAAQGGGARPHPGGLRHRPRPPRRGDRPHPRRGDPGRGARRPDGAVRPHRDPGQGHPGHAAAAPDRPRAAEDPGRAEGGPRRCIADLRDILAPPAAHRRHHRAPS